MNAIYTATLQQEPKTVDIEMMVRALAQAVPQEYMLIDPQGRVFKGPNPMVLAAQAMPQMAIQDISRDPPFRF